MEPQQHDGAIMRVVPTGEVGDELRTELHELFAVAYEHADPSYLDRSLTVLRYVATAHRDGALVAFSLGDTRIVDLPRLPEQPIGLAGLSCVHPAVQRRGFFSRMAQLPLSAEPIEARMPVVVTGRMAHPASMRAAALSPGYIPRPGHVPTEWQQEVAAGIAELYGVTEFDPVTMVCRGRGSPIGTPVVTLDVTDEEWLVFADVDRSRGDSVLAVAWQPFAPEGWDT